MIKEKFNLTEDENKMCFQIAMRSHTCLLYTSLQEFFDEWNGQA